MASIIALDAHRAQDRELRVRSAGQAACEIVIFPGVRYERWVEDPSAASKPGSKKTRKRRQKPN